MSIFCPLNTQKKPNLCAFMLGMMLLPVASLANELNQVAEENQAVNVNEAVNASRLYILGHAGNGVGSQNELSETLLGIGAGYQWSDQIDFQAGINATPNNEADEQGLAAYAEVRARLPLSAQYSLYGALGVRSQGENTQGGLGVLYHHDNHWTWDVGYRYYGQPNSAVQGDVYGFVVGLEYHFAKPESVTVIQPSSTAVIQPSVVPVAPVKTHQAIVLKGEFGHDSRVLSASVKTDLDRVASILRQYPQATVQLIGHTDSVGAARYNQTLSERRANAAALYLQDVGIDKTRLISSGEGETNPIADNSTKQGRSQNRRVEIIIQSFQYSTPKNTPAA